MIIFLKSNSHSRFLQKIRQLILVNVNNKKELNTFVLLSCISPKVADNCNFCEIFNGLKKILQVENKNFSRLTMFGQLMNVKITVPFH